MTRDILTAKIARGFDYLDANGDGMLTEYDHIVLGRRAAAGLGHEAGSPEEDRIIAGYMTVWNDLHRPHLPEGTDRIDKASFIASTKSLAEDPAAAEATLGVLAQAFLSVADADGSGSVSVEEYAVFQLSHFPDLDRDDIDKGFARLDSDGDGRITAEEFTSALIEFWTSKDPAAPGNWFLGEPASER